MGLVIVFAVVSIWWQSFRMPAAVYIVSTAVVAVIVLPMVLPMSRRLPLFVRWFVVTALLVYLGVLSLCTGMHFSS